MRRERRETCHQPGSGSSAAAALADPRWRTGGWTGPRRGQRCAGREEGKRGRARRESPPGPSLLSSEKTFSGRPETLSWARRVSGGGELRVCATRGDSAPGPQGGEWGSPGEGLELSAQLPRRIEQELAVHSGHRLAGHGPGGLGKAPHLGATGWGPQHGAGSSDPTQQGDGGDRTGDPRVGAGGGGEAVWLSVGWGDAADRGTQAVPGDRKRKFACLPLSFSLCLRRQI